MLSSAAVAMLFVFGAMAVFFPVAGIYEYVLCPLWEKWHK